MNNLTLSFELVSLLKWFLENKKEALQELVAQAIKHNFLHQDFVSGAQQINNNNAHLIINEFVEFLEQNLKERLNYSDSLETDLREQLSELACDVDLSSFDDATILDGFRQAKKQMARISMVGNDPTVNKILLKTMLMQTILASWQPNKAAAQA